jgi:hypothetical protein
VKEYYCQVWQILMTWVKLELDHSYQHQSQFTASEVNWLM